MVWPFIHFLFTLERRWWAEFAIKRIWTSSQT